MSNQQPMPFILSLLSEATTENLTFDNITIVQDGIAHLPCRNSNTWRKNHGWSDLGGPGSSHSNSAASRWESAVVPCNHCVPQAPKVEEGQASPPMPPKRQTSYSSVTSACSNSMSLIAEAQRCSATSSTSSTCSSRSSSTRKKFNYPSVLNNTLEGNGSNHSTESVPLMPSVTPCKPERQVSASQSSLLELTSNARRQKQQQQASNNKQLHIPLSLFSAPSMPQRQESVSTLGSRQSSFSTLSTQDSFRSLVSQQVDASLSSQSGSYRSLASQQPSLQADSHRSLDLIVEEEEPKEFALSVEEPRARTPSPSKKDRYSPRDVLDPSKWNKTTATPRRGGAGTFAPRQEIRLLPVQ